MIHYSHEVEKMCCVAKGPHHGPAPIPEEGKWVKAYEIKDVSGFSHGIARDFSGKIVDPHRTDVLLNRRMVLVLHDHEPFPLPSRNAQKRRVDRAELRIEPKPRRSKLLSAPSYRR